MRLRIVIIFILVVLFIWFTFVQAGDNPGNAAPVLKPGDVKHFIETFPDLKADLKKYDVKYEAQSGVMTYPDAIKASSEFMAILKKHGWEANFFTKTAVIAMGYSAIVYGKEIKNADPELEKSIKEIESNPHLSAEMKKQLVEQLKSVKGVLANQQDVLNQNIHPDDLALIQPFTTELKAVLEDSKDN